MRPLRHREEDEAQAGNRNTAAWQEVQPVLMIAQPRAHCTPGDLTDSELAGRVYRQARCAGLRVDPDEWFPIAEKVGKARDQAAGVIAACAACLVRPGLPGALAAATPAVSVLTECRAGWAGRAGTTVAAPQLAGWHQRH
jgi:hypothetical protein